MFIFDKPPTPSCHASTIVEVDRGRFLAAWFGGKAEGARDVKIWLAAFDGKAWSKPAVVAEDATEPTWNPVLFKSGKGTLFLYYKAGRNPREWSGWVRRSTDGGKTWSAGEVLLAGFLGPIKNKPIEVKGAILAPSSVESYKTWTSWVERSTDDGKTWTRHGPIAVPGRPYGLIQPTLFVTSKGHILALNRSRGMGAIAEATSTDGGLTWSQAKLTTLPNPGSGIDGVTGADGYFYLAYNHTKTGRTPLNIGRSKDDGQTWEKVATAEDTPGEYSYPALIQASDGTLHLTYTWKRTHIKHLTFDPKKFK